MILNQIKADKATINKVRQKFKLPDQATNPTQYIDDNTIKDVIVDFQKYKNNLQIKDIFQYSNWQQVLNKIQARQQTKSRQLNKAKTDQRSIYQDDTYLVYNPQTHGQSRAYSFEAHWCVAQNIDHHWKSYHDHNLVNFYYVKNKKLRPKDKNEKINPLYMVRVAVLTDNKKDVYDYYDHRIQYQALNLPQQIKKLFKTLGYGIILAGGNDPYKYSYVKINKKDKLIIAIYPGKKFIDTYDMKGKMIDSGVDIAQFKRRKRKRSRQAIRRRVRQVNKILGITQSVQFDRLAQLRGTI